MFRGENGYFSILVQNSFPMKVEFNPGKNNTANTFSISTTAGDLNVIFVVGDTFKEVAMETVKLLCKLGTIYTQSGLGFSSPRL